MLKKLKAILLGGPPPDLPARPKGERVRPPKPAPEAIEERDSTLPAEASATRQSHHMPSEFERVFARDELDPTAWIGVDLDGTLSEHSDAISLDQIGPPVPQMVARVKDWIGQGYTVKIFTARASIPEGIPPVERWLAEQGLPALEVTCEKDFHMIELWDDRGVQVIANLGQPVGTSQLDIPDAEDASPDDEAENEPVSEK